MIINSKIPFVSIIVPVYNAALTIENCVISLTSQTFTNIEILLINNGSTDNSLAICRKLASNDDRIRVVDHYEKGISTARNRGILESVGDFIMFVDADDWIDSNVCEVFAKHNAKNEYDLFCFSAQYHKRKKITKTYLFEQNIDLMNDNQKEELQIKIFAPRAPHLKFKVNTRFADMVWGRFYRRKIIIDKNFRFVKNLAISEDCLFNILALDDFYRIGYSKDVYYHYKLHLNQSAQYSFRANSDKSFGFIINQVQRWLLEAKKNKKIINAANCLFVHYVFGILKEDIFHLDNPQTFKQKKEKFKEVLEKEPFCSCLKNYNSDYFSLSEKCLLFLIKKKCYELLAVFFYFYNRILLCLIDRI